jgi:hypothetical protein
MKPNNPMLIARGGDGSIEVKQAIEWIEHLLVINDVSNVQGRIVKLTIG